MTAGRRLAVTESAVIIRDCAVKVLESAVLLLF